MRAGRRPATSEAGAKRPIIDPRLLTMTEYRLGHAPRILHATDELDGEDVLPDFRLPVAKLFE
jgi:hypothetical protein